MIELLRYFGLPVGISTVSGRIDEIIVIVHYLMLVLFVGWGAFFIYSFIKFRASKNKKANYWYTHDVPACDIPEHFIHSAFKHISNAHKDLDLIYWTGD